MLLKNLSPEEWEQIESEDHDRQYRDSLPFNSNTYKINTDQVIWYEDYCYKKGRRDRGHRTKRCFELINLKEIKGKTILDVGCGNGQYSVFFALLGAKVYGIDITPVGISIAKKIANANCVDDSCHFSVQNAASMDFGDSTFDIILMHEVLHHTIKYPGVKDEVLRVLKDNGAFICAEGLDGNPIFRFGRFFTMKGKEAKGDVLLTLSCLEEFASEFSDCKIELMSLLFMSKRVFRSVIDYAPFRFLLYILKRTDDVLLSLFPGLKKYCGEVVLVARK